jgi:hypothetical protein
MAFFSLIAASECRLGIFQCGSSAGNLVQLLVLALGQIGERFKAIKKFGMHQIWRKEEREYSTPQAESSNSWRVFRPGHEWKRMVRVMRHGCLQSRGFLLAQFLVEGPI